MEDTYYDLQQHKFHSFKSAKYPIALSVKHLLSHEHHITWKVKVK